MRRVEEVITVQAPVEAVERLWFDTSQWRHWVDGFDHVVEVTEEWPDTGGLVRWMSSPQGRGGVVELVVERVPGSRQVLEIQDETIEGTQTISFVPTGEGVDVVLEMAYRITERSFITGLFERLFVTRAMRASLAETLSRFAGELDATAGDVAQ